jgi:2,5-diketo-D-gluconate reductase B
LPAIPKINGIPLFGFGTYPLTGDDAYRAVRMALDLGIFHIDTAQMYGNEKDVGRALRDSGVDRRQLYVVTKIDPGNAGPDLFAATVAKSMDELGSPADLLLIHWPPAGRDFEAVLDRLMEARRAGLTAAIGVSNFSRGMMRRAHRHTGGAIVNNQVEFHPLLDQQALLETASELGIAVSAYSPLARGKALEPETIRAIARRHGRPASEIVLRWIIQQKVIAIPMTTKRENALSNLNALSFTLPEDDMVAITKLGSPAGRTINPARMTGRWDE